MMLRAVLILALLAFAPGCQAFRAQIGGGIGIGADIKLPGLVHTGLSAGQFMNIGIRYDDPELSNDVEVNAIAYHWSGRHSRGPEHRRRLISEHSCWAGVPPITTIEDKDDNLSAWDFEIGIMALVLDIRLGFGPARLERPKKIRAVAPSRASPPQEQAHESEARGPDLMTPGELSAPPARLSDAPEHDQDPLAPR